MIVVTGGSGFIGSALIWALNKQQSTDILVVDHFGTSSKWKNLTNLKFVDCIEKNDFLLKLEEGSFDNSIDCIFHMGACSSTTEMNMSYLIKNNFEYTKILAQKAVNMKWPFLYASSAATYGSGENGFSDKTDILKLRPLNPYGFSKQLFDIWAHHKGLLSSITGLKYFNVFGPNEYHKDNMKSVVCKTFHRIKETGQMSLFKSHRSDYKDGEQARDFLYIKDAVRMTLAIYRNKLKGLFNIGTGTARTFLDLSKSVFQSMDLKPAIDFVPTPEDIRSQYQYYTCADMSTMKESEAFSGCFSLEDGIDDYVRNYLSTENPFLGNSSNEKS